MARNKVQDAEMMLKIATDGGREWLDALIRTHEDAVRTLKTRRAEFEESCKGAHLSRLATPVQLISWTVNDVNNTARNTRLDMAVNHASAIALAQNALREAKGE